MHYITLENHCHVIEKEQAVAYKTGNTRYNKAVQYYCEYDRWIPCFLKYLCYKKSTIF